MNAALDPNHADKPQPASQTQRPASQNLAPRQAVELKVSRFESVTSLLLALMLLLGCFAMLLLAIWLLSNEPHQHSPERPLPTLGSSAAPGKSQRDFLPPSPDEIVKLQEPTLEEAIVQISKVAASAAASTDHLLASRQSDGGNDGLDDGRHWDRDGVSKDRGPKHDFVPEHARWEIAFNAKSKQDYARQLDHFSIELAAFGGGKAGIDTATSLASNPTAGHIGDPSTENRLYFSWKRQNPLLQYDRQLLAAAGIDTEGREIIRFIDDSLRQKLLSMEQLACEEAGKAFPQSIRKTYFECVSVSGKYQFRIVEQRYQIGR